jgi:acyl-CoA dehydrogenase
MIRNQATLDARLATARRIVRDSWTPAEDEVERTASIPEALIREMREHHLFGLVIPETYGGEGMTCEELALMNIELSQCSVAFRTRIANNNGVGANVVTHGGDASQKARYLPRIASGELLIGVGMTEPAHGSDATALETRAEFREGHWVLDGEKAFITNGPVADAFVIFARTGEAGARGISAFLVETGTPGFRSGPAYRAMGQHGAPFSTLYLEDCRVPPGALLGGVPGKGFSCAWHAFVFQRIQLAALSIGPAVRLIEEGVRWVRERHQFGKPIGEHQLIQAMLADCQTELFAARALVMETARLYDLGEDVTMRASMCKYLATEMACKVADRIVQLHGARGYMADFSSVERLFRDVRAGRFAEGTSEIHQLTIAKAMLKDATP